MRLDFIEQHCRSPGCHNVVSVLFVFFVCEITSHRIRPICVMFGLLSKVSALLSSLAAFLKTGIRLRFDELCAMWTSRKPLRCERLQPVLQPQFLVSLSPVHIPSSFVHIGNGYPYCTL